MTVPVFELNAKVIIPNNTAGVNSAMNQSEFSSISRDFLKGREKSCVQGEGEYILVLLLIGCKTDARF